MKKPNYGIEEALTTVKDLLAGGTHKDFLLIALVADGFDDKKAQKIIEWASVQIKMNGELNAII